MLLGKYNQEKTVRFRLFQVDGVDFESAATFAAGDVKIMKDEGVEANTTNLPTDEGQGYSLVLTATEMSAARIEIYIVDQTATKVWLDTGLSIETYGNASAEHAFDLDTASTAQTADHTAGIADIPTVAEFNARTLAAADYFDPATDTVAAVTTVASVSGSVGSVTGSVGSVTGAVGSVTAQVSADVTAISGDSTAADNLELQYDGTGLVGDTYPATQTQVGQLSTGSASISKAASTAVITAGAETNTYTSTKSRDGVYHEIADAAGVIDFYYEFDIGGNGVGADVQFFGRMTGVNDNLDIFAYDWANTTWDQVGTTEGENTTTDWAGFVSLDVSHTGTGANAGKVRVRAYKASGLTSAVLYMDQIYISYAVVAESVGYAQGRVWINTDAANTNTNLYRDGTADNPVSTLTAAKTIADSLGIKDFHVTSNSTITLLADLNGYNVYGVGYALNTAGYDLAGTHILHSSPINGTVTTAGSSDHWDALDSIIDTVTADDAHLTNCIFIGTYTFGTSAIVTPEVNMNHCKSGIAGASAPVFTKTPGATLTWSVRDWKGGMTINGLEAGDTVTIGGGELGTITLNGADASVEVRGIAKAVTNNLTGSPTVNLDGVVIASDVASISSEIGTAGANLTDLGGMSSTMRSQVNTEADTALTDYDGPTNTEFEARTPTAAQLAYIVANAATGMPVTFTTSGGSTTAAVLNNVDGAAASATDDQYNGRLLVFTDGTLKGCVTDITDYVGSTTTATITAIPFAPESTHNARLL